jgi:hypothetical protein
VAVDFAGDSAQCTVAGTLRVELLVRALVLQEEERERKVFCVTFGVNATSGVKRAERMMNLISKTNYATGNKMEGEKLIYDDDNRDGQRVQCALGSIFTIENYALLQIITQHVYDSIACSIVHAERCRRQQF